MTGAVAYDLVLLRALTVRLKTLERADHRRLNAEIACALIFRHLRPAEPGDHGVESPGANAIRSETGFLMADSFASSVDACARLLERVLPGWFWRCGAGSVEPGWAHINRWHPDHCDVDDEGTGWASTPAAAFLVAIIDVLIRRQEAADRRLAKGAMG